MTVAELLRALATLPGDTDLFVAIDGRRLTMLGVPMAAKLVASDRLQLDPGAAGLTPFTVSWLTGVGEHR